MKQLLSIIILVTIGISPALAISLQSAKEQGLVGERSDGYLGYVTSSPNADLKTLVKGVNNKRKAKFRSTASNNNITVEQVGKLFYQRAVKETKSGHFYQDPSGRWTKK